MKRKLKKLSRMIPLLVSLCLLFACAKEQTVPAGQTEPTDTEQVTSPVLLKETDDRGREYLDSFVFLGESTTYHLIHREVLKGGRNTTQVWGPDSGTINLDTTITSIRIRYPETGEYLTVGEAAAKRRPAYLVLTFGLNGAVQNVRRGEDYYKSCYRLLLDELQAASPHTRLILQSCFPVAKNMDMQHYTVTQDQLNDCIETINGWTLELAEEYGLRYLNTAEVLKDEKGRLKMEYQVGDGHHLTRGAYVEILNYIRTHGYQ